MLSDLSDGTRKEIAGITTLDEAKEALNMLTRLGVPRDAAINHYLRVGWTGRPRVTGEEPDPLGRMASLSLWAKADGT
jgi:hypothetical protein